MGRSIMYLPIAKKDYKGMNAISDPLSIDFLGNNQKIIKSTTIALYILTSPNI